MKTATPFTVIAICTALPGQEQVLRSAQEKLVAETLEESGCLRYELNQSLDDPHILIFTETWATEKHWQDHMEGAAIQHFQAQGGRALMADFVLHRIKPTDLSDLVKSPLFISRLFRMYNDSLTDYKNEKIYQDCRQPKL